MGRLRAVRCVRKPWRVCSEVIEQYVIDRFPGCGWFCAALNCHQRVCCCEGIQMQAGLRCRKTTNSVWCTHVASQFLVVR